MGFYLHVFFSGSSDKLSPPIPRNCSLCLQHLHPIAAHPGYPPSSLPHTRGIKPLLWVEFHSSIHFQLSSCFFSKTQATRSTWMKMGPWLGTCSAEELWSINWATADEAISWWAKWGHLPRQEGMLSATVNLSKVWDISQPLCGNLAHVYLNLHLRWSCIMPQKCEQQLSPFWSSHVSSRL